MLALLDRLESKDVGALLLRLTVGCLMLFHGVHKILHPDAISWMPGALAQLHMPGFVAYGVYVGEVIAPIMLLLGYYARIGSLLIVVNMLFAFFMAHTAMVFALSGNGGYALELQAFYGFVALALVFIGPGKFAMNSH